MKVPDLEEQQGRNIYLSRFDYLSTTKLPWTTPSPYKKSCSLCTDQWQISVWANDPIVGRCSWNGVNLAILIIQYTRSIASTMSYWGRLTQVLPLWRLENDWLKWSNNVLYIRRVKGFGENLEEMASRGQIAYQVIVKSRWARQKKNRKNRDKSSDVFSLLFVSKSQSWEMFTHLLCWFFWYIEFALIHLVIVVSRH